MREARPGPLLPGEREQRDRQATLSCIVPAYNEAINLKRLIPALTDMLQSLSDTVEIVVVNDGSRDDTDTVMATLVAQYPVRYLSLSRNFGKEAALTAGLESARGDVVIMMDADFQHPLEVLPIMHRHWREGCDMVYAVRETREDESWLKRYGTKLFYTLMSRGSHVEITPDAGDFRLLDRRVVNAILQLPERNRFMKGLYAWVGFRSMAIPYTPADREHGETTFGFKALMRLAVTGLTAFTDLPLRVWSAVGMLVSLGALSYGGWIIFTTLVYGVDAPGFATIVTSIMFFSGVQLLSVGVLGEYLARVYNEVKRRPNYLVGHCLDNSPLKDDRNDLS